MSEVTKVWKSDLERQNPKAAEALADPDEYPNLFPDLEWALKVWTDGVWGSGAEYASDDLGTLTSPHSASGPAICLRTAVQGPPRWAVPLI